MALDDGQRARVPAEVGVVVGALTLVCVGQLVLGGLSSARFGEGGRRGRDAGVVDKRRAVELLTPAELLEQAKRARADKKLDRAIDLLEQCLELEPRSVECHLMLGSVLAGIASRNDDAQARARAQVEYERFLELADPADPRVAQVKQILAVAAKIYPPPKFELEIGATRKLYRMGLMRATSSDPAVLKVEARDDDLLMKGVAPGKVTVTAWLFNNTRESWTVTVR